VSKISCIICPYLHPAAVPVLDRILLFPSSHRYHTQQYRQSTRTHQNHRKHERLLQDVSQQLHLQQYRPRIRLGSGGQADAAGLHGNKYGAVGMAVERRSAWPRLGSTLTNTDNHQSPNGQHRKGGERLREFCFSMADEDRSARTWDVQNRHRYGILEIPRMPFHHRRTVDGGASRPP